MMKKKSKNQGEVVGLAVHVLIGGLMILTGSEKLLGFVPPEALAKYGLGEEVPLIGAGALLTALLLLIPRTSSLGILLTSSFWGGAICLHMAHGEAYVFQAVLLVLSWVGSYLRNPATLCSISGPTGLMREVAAGPEPAALRPGPALTPAAVVGLSRPEHRENATEVCPWIWII
jgi:hypothetical protein